jgi:hypothetical protein
MATNWHRIFGLMLTDFFLDSPFRVELEKDLSLKKQLLDVVILRRGAGRFAGRLRGPGGAQPHHLQVAPGGAGRLGPEGADRPLRQLPQAAGPGRGSPVVRGRLSAVCCL